MSGCKQIEQFSAGSLQYELHLLCFVTYSEIITYCVKEYLF